MPESYAQRVANVRAMGYSSLHEYRKAPVAQRAARAEALKRERPSYKGGARSVIGGKQRAERGGPGGQRRVSVRTPAGDVVSTLNTRTVLGNLRRWGDRGVHVLVDMKDGEQFHLFRHGGWRADRMADAIRAQDAPRVKNALADWLAAVYGASGDYEPGDIASAQFTAFAR